MGFIYCLTSPSGKKYIGQTSRSVEKRLKEHAKCYGYCIALEHAINKYGFSNFKVDIMMEVNNELLNYYEAKLIDFLDTMEPNGYNIRAGGAVNSYHSPQSRERMRQAKLGELNYNFGKPRTDETCKRISAAKSGEKHHFYGKEFSYNHKLALSKSHKSDNLPMYLVHLNERPSSYQGEGYAIINHPTLKTKYFTSKKLTIDEKLKLATEYLNSCNMDAVQRLNGDGSLLTNSSKENTMA